jgi:hypothetical protein
MQWALIDYAPPFEISTALHMTLESLSLTLQSPYGTSVYTRWPTKRSKLAAKIPYAATWSVRRATDVEKASMPKQGNECSARPLLSALLIILKEKVHNSRSSSRNKLPQWVAQIVQVINFSTRKVDRQT